MSLEVWGMIVAGIAALVAGLVLARPRFQAASGVEKVLVLGPICEAIALAMFSAEHFTAAHDLMPIVPRWLPGHLFWTYFVGAAWLAAAISFIAWRQVRWSALLSALLFLIIVATVSLPSLPQRLHERLFWTLIVRETGFACGAMVLAGSVWPRGSRAGPTLTLVGRAILAPIFVFYAIQHFLFPRYVPGVPLGKLIPEWWPAPVLLSSFVGITLLLAGIGLVIPRTTRPASALLGSVLVVLTAVFYVPIFMTEIRTPLAVEGLNYIGDTLLFAGTALLAGLGAD